MVAAASLSSVNDIPDMAVVPPTSDIMRVFVVPSGATSIMSMSVGNVCDKPFILTVTL